MVDSATIVADMNSKLVRDPGLVPLGKGIYIKRPSESASEIASTSAIPPPTLILIFAWMGAAMPHILKYTKVYDDLYPSATQIVVRSEPSFFWSSEKTNRKNLRPVIEVLEALGYLSSTNTTNTNPNHQRLLVHSFSNGGSSQLSCLNRVLASRAERPIAPTTTALILDSNPGIGRMVNGRKAFAASQPNIVGRAFVHIIFAFLFLYAYLNNKLIDGAPDFFAQMREDLNTDGLLAGWLKKTTPRLYLYSESDEMVPFADVEQHIRDAESRGFEVISERFKNSKHVAHARAEPERYWGSVQDLWERAIKAS